jgi:hypothetical protein
VEVLFALGYLDMGATIGKSDSSKVLFIDPRTIPAAFEGMRSVISNGQIDSNDLFSKQIPGLEGGDKTLGSKIIVAPTDFQSMSTPMRESDDELARWKSIAGV